MNDFTLCVPCLLGLEGPIADELKRLKLQNVRNENGRVYFSGGDEAIARANINLRIGERVLIELGRFEAKTFDELFEKTKALPWETLIPKDAAFPVKGYSLNSKLFSVSDCQKIIKKAVVERLKRVYGIEWFPETREVYQIQFSIMKDTVSMCIDTSGAGLHKRGYRPAHNVAPLKETMAAAMVTLSRYRGREDFCDPFCGSGTIPIEAALIAKNRAPGLNRDFAAQSFRSLDPKVWTLAREEARSREYSGNYRIIGSDIDPNALEIAKENAARAGQKQRDKVDHDADRFREERRPRRAGASQGGETAFAENQHIVERNIAQRDDDGNREHETRFSPSAPKRRQNATQQKYTSPRRQDPGVTHLLDDDIFRMSEIFKQRFQPPYPRRQHGAADQREINSLP